MSVTRAGMIRALAVVLAAAAPGALAAEYTVGAHYYPWYGSNNFHSPPGIISAIRWYLLPAQQPALGWYDSHDPQAISAHFLWARGAGIDFFICSYWGSTDDTALTIKNYMLPNPDIGDLKLCVMLDGNPTTGPITKDNVASETLWLCDNLFGAPGYLRIDGKPVVMAYDVIKLSDSDLAAYCSSIRSAASSRGYQVYLVGDEAYGDLPRSSPTRSSAARCANFDAVMSYNQYSMLRTFGAGKYASQTSVNLWDANNGDWKNLANSVGVSFFPCVEPGFNDSEVRGSHHTPMSRKLGSDSGSEGSLFSAQLDKAKTRCDRGIILVTTWNEWHEDTQIEPCVPAGAVTSAIDTSLPYQLMPGETGAPTTGGLKYVGYDTTYLDILRAKTSDVPVPPAPPSNPGSADITTTSITWTWQDNSTNETGFRLYADPGSGMPFTLRSAPAANDTSWVYTGLTSNTRYSFQVYAVNGTSPSLRSPIHSAVTLADPPTVGVNVVCDKNPGQAYVSGTSFVFTNPIGFGGEGPYTASGFQYVWDTDPTHVWNGSEGVWNAGSLAFSPASEGAYYLHLRSMNLCGAPSPEALDYGPFCIDATAPSGTILINSGAAYTNSTSVTLTLSAADPPSASSCQSGVAEMRLANSGSPWNPWEPYSTSRSWTLGTGDGTKRVYAQFRDAAGNVSATAVDSIVLDTSPPSAPGTPTDAGAYTSEGLVVFTWSPAADARSGIEDYRCRIGTAPGTADVFDGYVGGVPAKSILGTIGSRYYCSVCARDGAGNVGPWSGWSDGISVVKYPGASIPTGKAARDGESLGIPSRVVTAVFWDRFYIQEPDRASGLMVRPPDGMPAGLEVGSMVDVGGPVATNAAGEREIQGTVSIVAQP